MSTQGLHFLGKSIDGRMLQNAKFDFGYKKFIITELNQIKDADSKIKNAELYQFNYIPKIGQAAFGLGLPETAYFLIQLDRNGMIKLSNIHFEPGGSFIDQGRDYFGKTITLDKLFELVETGYLKSNWSAKIIFDIDILRDTTNFVDIESIYKDLLKRVFEIGVFEWRCLICGSPVAKITSVQQYHYYLNGFDINKRQRCNGRKDKHLNWYQPDVENNALVFFARFSNMPETIELNIKLNGLLFDTNKYIIPKDKRKKFDRNT